MGRRDYLDDPLAPKANSIAIAVSVFVLDGTNRLLMIRRTDNNLYAIPGGQLEVGETLSGAARREVQEETGVGVDISGVIGLYSNPHHVIEYDDGEVRQEFSICFRGKLIGGSPRGSSESSEALWVERTRLDALDIHPSIRLRISHGFEMRTTTYFT